MFGIVVASIVNSARPALPLFYQYHTMLYYTYYTNYTIYYTMLYYALLYYRNYTKYYTMLYLLEL